MPQRPEGSALKRLHFTVPLLFSLFLGLPPLIGMASPATAQSDAQNGYQPPPMFGTPEQTYQPPAALSSQTTTAPVASTPGPAKSVSPAVPVKPEPARPPVIAPRVSPAPKPRAATPSVPRPQIQTPIPSTVKTAPVPVPPRKPQTAAAETPLPIPVPETKAVQEAPSEPEKQPIPPAPQKTEGVVRGPKTMPAVPAGSVDKEVTFEETPEQKNEPTLLERHLQEKQDEKIPSTPSEPAIEDGKKGKSVPLPPPTPSSKLTFDSKKAGVLKKILPFEAGQKELPPEDLKIIAEGVAAELNSKKDWRVQIRSFATPQDQGPSGDRRAALARALSLRSSLLSQGIAPDRIDLRAVGLDENNQGPADRIDLYLFGPAVPGSNTP